MRKLFILSTFFIICLLTALFFSYKNNPVAASAKPNSISFVQMSDMHLENKGENISARMYKHSEELFSEAINQINQIDDIDFSVFSGDLTRKATEEDFMFFIKTANKLKKPWFFIPGNHDVNLSEMMTKQAILKLFKKHSPYFDNNELYYCFSPQEDFLFIFLDGIISNITPNGFFEKKQLQWLEKKIKDNQDKKIIIVQHFPVVEPFKSNSHKVLNSAEYLAIIDRYQNIIAILSGHYHCTKIIQRKNVAHISTPSLIEYPNAFRKIKITIDKDRIKFDIKLIETNLKKIQLLSKNKSKHWKLMEGKEKDKNTSFWLTTSLSNTSNKNK